MHTKKQESPPEEVTSDSSSLTQVTQRPENTDPELDDIDLKPDPILMYLPDPSEAEQNFSPEYPVISIKVFFKKIFFIDLILSACY